MSFNSEDYNRSLCAMMQTMDASGVPKRVVVDKRSLRYTQRDWGKQIRVVSKRGVSSAPPPLLSPPSSYWYLT